MGNDVSSPLSAAHVPSLRSNAHAVRQRRFSDVTPNNSSESDYEQRQNGSMLPCNNHSLNSSSSNDDSGHSDGPDSIAINSGQDTLVRTGVGSGISRRPFLSPPPPPYWHPAHSHAAQTYSEAASFTLWQPSSPAIVITATDGKTGKLNESSAHKCDGDQENETLLDMLTKNNTICSNDVNNNGDIIRSSSSDGRGGGGDDSSKIRSTDAAAAVANKTVMAPGIDASGCFDGATVTDSAWHSRSSAEPVVAQGIVSARTLTAYRSGEDGSDAAGATALPYTPKPVHAHEQLHVRS